MPRKIGFTLLLFLLAGHCWAAAVLDTNSSASSLGFGGRNTAVVQNAADWLANPAGLTDLKSVQFGSTYANLFWEDIGYLYLGSTFPLQDKGVTFAAAYREIKTDIDYDLSYLEAASTFAVGYELSQSLSVGLALNRINVQSLYSGTGFSLDLGLLKKQGFGQIGASIKNVYSSLSYSTGLTEKIEPRFNFGMVYNLNRRNRVFLEMDNLSFISFFKCFRS